jgi:hypothetical protein
MGRVKHRPHERYGYGFNAFVDEQLARISHILLVHRGANVAIGQNALAHALAQVARHKHLCRRILRIVAVAIFLVAETDLDRVFMARSADKAGLGPLVLDQRIEPNGGAIDAQVTIADDLAGTQAEVLGDKLQPVLDGPGRIIGRRQRLVEMNLACLVSQYKVGEGAAGVDAQSVFGTHCRNSVLSVDDHVCEKVFAHAAFPPRARSALVAAMSTSRVFSSEMMTP